jgi:RNA polymerase subunit RPABC4/transcription elongation factor Spt4
MAGNTKIVREPTEMVIDINSCSGCGSEINGDTEMCPNCSVAQPGISHNSSSSDVRNKDPIADGLLRLCAIINGTWDNILTSIQSISFLREVALYIDCTILAIWKNKKQPETKEITKSCSRCGFKIDAKDEICPKCGIGQGNIRLK